MSTNYEIPLSPQAQNFTIMLVGVAYQFTLTWNVINATWMVNIADSSGNPIVSSIPLVTGVDLLEQYGYLDFGFQLIVQTDNAPDVVPTYANLGTTGHLYAIVP